MKVNSKASVRKTTSFAKKIQNLLEAKLAERITDFDPEKLKYTGLMRADIQICGYHSILNFAYITQNDGFESWGDFSVGLIQRQKDLKGDLILTQEDDGVSYMVSQTEEPLKYKDKSYVFNSYTYESVIDTPPTTAQLLEFYSNLRKWHIEIKEWSDQAIHNAWYKYSTTIHNIDFVDWVTSPENSFLGFLYIMQENPNFVFSPQYIYEGELEEYSDKKPWVFNIPCPAFLTYKFK